MITLKRLRCDKINNFRLRYIPVRIRCCVTIALRSHFARTSVKNSLTITTQRATKVSIINNTIAMRLLSHCFISFHFTSVSHLRRVYFIALTRIYLSVFIIHVFPVCASGCVSTAITCEQLNFDTTALYYHHHNHQLYPVILATQMRAGCEDRNSTYT